MRPPPSSIGAWNATSDAAFATLDTAAGNGNGYVHVTVGANPDLTDRIAKVTLNGIDHILTQKGKAAGPSPPRTSWPRAR